MDFKNLLKHLTGEELTINIKERREGFNKDVFAEKCKEAVLEVLNKEIKRCFEINLQPGNARKFIVTNIRKRENCNTSYERWRFTLYELTNGEYVNLGIVNTNDLEHKQNAKEYIAKKYFSSSKNTKTSPVDIFDKNAVLFVL